MAELRFVEIGLNDSSFVRGLYQESFPANERMDFESLFSPVPKGKKRVMEIYDGAYKAGFISVFEYEDNVYLLYFAISPLLRGKGIGTQALRMLCKQAGTKRVVIDIERIQEGEKDGVKSRRRNFYLRNGFIPSGYYSRFYGVDYEYLVYGKIFGPDEYMDLMASLWGNGGLEFELVGNTIKVKS